jgi:hypothetical protein
MCPSERASRSAPKQQQCEQPNAVEREWRLNCSFATAPNTHTILYLLTHEAREIIVVHHGIANHGHLDVGYSRLGKGHEAHQGHRHDSRSAARVEDPRRCRGQRHDNPGPQSPKDMVDSAHGLFHFVPTSAQAVFSSQQSDKDDDGQSATLLFLASEQQPRYRNRRCSTKDPMSRGGGDCSERETLTASNVCLLLAQLDS